MTTITHLIKTFTLVVIASEAKQSSVLAGQSGLPRRFAPRKDGNGASA